MSGLQSEDRILGCRGLRQVSAHLAPAPELRSRGKAELGWSRTADRRVAVPLGQWRGPTLILGIARAAGHAQGFPAALRGGQSPTVTMRRDSTWTT